MTRGGNHAERVSCDLPEEFQSLDLLGDRLLVEVKEEGKSSGGILLPDGSKEKICSGSVKMIGPGKLNKDCTSLVPILPSIKIDCLVYYNKWSASEFQSAKGRKYVLVKQDDVVAVKY